MSKLLQLQLENEEAIFAKLKREGRNDIIAQIVLSRIEREIMTLKRKLDDEQETRQTVDEPRRASRFIRYVREIMYRFRNYEDRRDYSIFQIPAITPLQTQAGTK